MTADTPDEFATLLLEEAKRFLEKYQTATKVADRADAYLHASLLLGYCALEAHINNVAEDFADRPEFTVHEQGLLKEREIILRGGQFHLSSSLKMSRLEDRLEFLYRRFAKCQLDKKVAWWGRLRAGLNLRNALTHSRSPQVISEKDVTDALHAILEAIDVLFRAVYHKAYPARSRQLDSKLDF